MRIIGGTYKRKKLISVPGMDTRPTTDRIRESVFNILTGRISGRHVLDLFSGTGALGLEALSRGALTCMFVDMAKASETVIRKNIASCGIKENTRVIRHDITKDLRCLKRSENPFDLVFMDPPYDREMIGKTLEKLLKSGALNPGAILVVEHAPAEPPPRELAGVTLMDTRSYGKNTVITFLEYHASPET